MKLSIFVIAFLLVACEKSSSSEINSPQNEGAATSIVASPDSPDKTWTETFMELVNNHRKTLSLKAIIHAEDLGAIAITHSENMASGSVDFGHDGFSDRCAEGKSALGGGNWCAENVANGQKTPEAAFTSWMNSPGHRANIESTKATHTGFGYAKTSSGKYYWTQIFIQH